MKRFGYYCSWSSAQSRDTPIRPNTCEYKTGLSKYYSPLALHVIVYLVYPRKLLGLTLHVLISLALGLKTPFIDAARSFLLHHLGGLCVFWSVSKNIIINESLKKIKLKSLCKSLKHIKNTCFH